MDLFRKLARYLVALAKPAIVSIAIAFFFGPTPLLSWNGRFRFSADRTRTPSGGELIRLTNSGDELDGVVLRIEADGPCRATAELELDGSPIPKVAGARDCSFVVFGVRSDVEAGATGLKTTKTHVFHGETIVIEVAPEANWKPTVTFLRLTAPTVDVTLSELLIFFWVRRLLAVVVTTTVIAVWVNGRRTRAQFHATASQLVALSKTTAGIRELRLALDPHLSLFVEAVAADLAPAQKTLFRVHLFRNVVDRLPGMDRPLGEFVHRVGMLTLKSFLDDGEST